MNCSQKIQTLPQYRPQSWVLRKITTMGQEALVKWSEVEELLSMVQCAFQFKGKAIEVCFDRLSKVRFPPDVVLAWPDLCVKKRTEPEKREMYCIEEQWRHLQVLDMSEEKYFKFKLSGKGTPFAICDWRRDYKAAFMNCIEGTFMSAELHQGEWDVGWQAFAGEKPCPRQFIYFRFLMVVNFQLTRCHSLFPWRQQTAGPE